MLVADDSAAARVLIRGILEADPGLEVVGQATDGLQAVELAERLEPDVITMDVDMPGVDGLEATRRIMARAPRPIVLVSGVLVPDLDNSFRALEAGAVTLLDLTVTKTRTAQVDLVLQVPTRPTTPGTSLLMM